MQRRFLVLSIMVCSVLATGCNDHVGIENKEEIQNLEVTENIEELENTKETGQQTTENPVAEDDISEIKEPEPDSILENEDPVWWIKRERVTLKCYKEIADVQTQFRKRGKIENFAQ